MYKPLADEIRPHSLDDVVGQKHILGERGLLRRIVESGSIPNMIFYGPSGTGKTTVARIIAEKTNRTLRKLNATTAGLADIKEIIAELDTLLTPGGVLLYLDEIQYFNKKQQQSLLEFIEDGRITLIASTTENPYFCVFGAILSRSTVFEFKPVTPKEAEPAVLRAFSILAEREGKTPELEPGVVQRISQSCGGDVRKALNAVELLFSAARTDGDKVLISLDDAKTVTQRSAMRYDRDGDEHYDVAVGADEVAARLGRGRGAALSCAAARGRRPRRRVPPDPVLGERGYRPCVSAGGAYSQGLRGLGASARACRRRACRWPRRSSSSPPRRNPTAALWRSTLPSPMSAPAKAVRRRASCKMSTPTARALSASRAINIRTATPTTGCGSSICPMRSRARTTTISATTRSSRPRKNTGTRSKSEVLTMPMDIHVGDVLTMKKAHPCGEKRWQVLRVGADFKLRCLGCGHEVMGPRSKFEKNIRSVCSEAN